MRRMFPAALLAIAASVVSHADSSQTNRRDKALDGIKVCLHRNEVSSRECKHLNQDVETLVDVYRSGDKSVLPTLFRFTYLTDFYDDALLSDPEGFLTAMAQLPKKEQQAVAEGIAGGGTFKALDVGKFKAIRALLTNVSDDSPTKAVAAVSLKAVENNNASLFVNYFPPGTFTSRAADFQIHWYSADMYALGESPLWPPSKDAEITYRLTYLPAFTGPSAITFFVSRSGEGRLAIRAIDENRDVTKVDETVAVPRDQVARFFALLDQAHFWTTTTELPPHGNDGAEWILEGVKDGKYRTVVRWCPAIERQSAEEIPFGKAGQLLFEIAGHKQADGC